jgi:3-oxoacyl-[acyl-carrier-protein] synthase II
MDLLRNGRRRVVITGIGAVSALGNAHALWDGVVSGRSGITQIETLDVPHSPVRIAGEVKNFEASDLIERKELRRMGRASQFAVTAADDAVRDAGLTASDIFNMGERVGVVVGTSLGSHEMSEQATYKYKTSNYRKPNPLSLISALPNMPSHYISRYLGALGPISTPSTACAAGTQSIGEASDFIKMNRADIMIAGGVEAILQDYTLAGFEAMNALAKGYEDNPTEASRPFDLNRTGFVFSEGCGIVVLENLSHALRRGARIYGEVLGYSSSSDAYHVAALDPEGRGAIRAMKWALEDAHIAPQAIDYINAHGTGTPANDLMETIAIKEVFKEHAYKMIISSTKGALGHALASSGALEVIICVKALQEKMIPPTINLNTPDPECDLDYTPNIARPYDDLRYVLSNSFGLGGQNASIVLGKI